MKSTYLLDCTLRDGGYTNDWEFGRDALERIFARLVASNVDFIEIGFLDDRCRCDENRSIMPTTQFTREIWGNADKGNATVLGMIDYGTCRIENLQRCEDSYFDGIRVIFKKHKMHDAIEYCKKVKALGYKTFANCVSITSYSDDELLELARKANELAPYALAMVDTYGVLHQDNLLHIFQVLDRNLDPDIKLAFHGHNNFQMGYANALAILNKETDRDIIVDGTLYGMGKSAGNAPLELLAMYMNERYGKNYDISQILECIEVDIMDCYTKSPWGYKPFYYVAAMNKCHPDYVAYLMNKKTLSIKSVNEILAMIDGEKKLLFDARLIEKLYLDYQRNECDDADAIERLRRNLKGRTVLLIGPGATILEEADAVRRYIAENRPITIALNYFPAQIQADYLFLTNRRRYSRIQPCLLREPFKALPVIATSNVVSTMKRFEYVLNYGNLIDYETEIPDNSMIMLLRTLIRCQVENIAMAGFDGYSPVDINYADTNMEYAFAKEKAEYLNQYAEEYFESIKDLARLEFLTKTRYIVGRGCGGTNEIRGVRRSPSMLERAGV